MAVAQCPRPLYYHPHLHHSAGFHQAQLYHNQPQHPVPHVRGTSFTQPHRQLPRPQQLIHAGHVSAHSSLRQQQHQLQHQSPTFALTPSNCFALSLSPSSLDEPSSTASLSPLSYSPSTTDSATNADDSCGNESTGGKKSAPTLATGRRNLKSEKVAPEEDKRRAARREKNRRAAAKCRQKRQNCIAVLEAQVQELEHGRANTETQVQQLQLEASRLLAMLELHADNCLVPGWTQSPTPAAAKRRTAAASEAGSIKRINSNNSDSNLEHVTATLVAASAASTSPKPTLTQAHHRPSDLPLSIAYSMTSASPLTLNTPPVLMTPGTYQPSTMSSSWEPANEGLGLTRLLSTLDTPKGDSLPFPGLVEIKVESEYVSL